MMARAMNIIVWCLMLTLLTWAISQRVSADEKHMQDYHGDPQYDQWFRSLMRPDTKTSCCNLNDCTQTQAEWRDDEWWAVVRGEWRAIPPEKIVQQPLSIDGEAYVCAGHNGTIFCFVPPIHGY